MNASPTAQDLVSRRVVTVEAEERLSDAAARIAAAQATHCAVVDAGRRAFLGVVRLRDLAVSAPERIFADLVAKPGPIDVLDTLDASLVEKLFQTRGAHELVVLSSTRNYVGIITRESFLEWRFSRK